MDAHVEVFELGPEARLKARRFIWLAVVVLAVAFLAFLAALALVPPPPPLSLVALLAAVMTVGGGVAVSVSARSAMQELASFRIALGTDVIRRVSGRLGPLELTRAEVVRIVELPPGLVLLAERPARALVVPRTLEGFARVRDTVSVWSPLEVRTSQRLVVAAVIALSVLGLGGLVASLTSPLPWLSALGSVVFFAVGGLFVWQLLRERQGDRQLRRRLLLRLALIGLAVGIRLVLPVLTEVRR